METKFKIGDKVMVINVRGCYRYYVDMAELMGLTNWNEGAGPDKNSEAIIINIEQQPEQNTLLIGIKTKDGKEYIIGENSLKLLEPDELSIKTFNFYLDQKVTTWMRTNFSVEGEDIEVARQKAVDFVKEGNTSELPWDEIMDTKEVMSLEENGGMSTEEIFEENGVYVYVNGKDGRDE